MTRVVIGVGNPFRCDDAAGLEVARRVQAVPALESSLGGFELMDLWQEADEVVIVDATNSGLAPGTIRCFDPLEPPLPQGAFASSHTIGVAETIEMARQLDRLPTSIAVYGIEAASVATGTTISAPVAAAIERLVAEIDHA